MLHITIITLGKLKESYWREAEAEYIKRLGAFVKLKIIELKEESFGDKDNKEIIKEKEAQKILTEIKKQGNSEIIVLDEHGKKFDSTTFAHQLNTLTLQHSNNLVFIIGGPLGLHPSITKLATFSAKGGPASGWTFSLSPLTFTHQMARIFLLEQLYRAMMIQNNRSYHY